MPTKPKKKGQHGGARKGAGRPRKVIAPWGKRTAAIRPEDADDVDRVASALAQMTALGGDLAWMSALIMWRFA
jgi:hypothetical protein